MTRPELLYLLQQGLNALTIAAIYALLATSYVLVHGVTRRINMAFGALSVWGGYLAVAAATLALDRFIAEPAAILIAVIAAVIGTASLGLAIGRLLRPLYARPSLAMLIATLGLAIALGEGIRLLAGNRDFWVPPLLDGTLLSISSDVFPVRVTLMQAVVVAGALALAASLVAGLKWHRSGRLWRAVSQDPRAAALCGIDARRVELLSVAVATAYAAIAGALMALYYGNVSFAVGLVIGLKALYVAVLGGLGSVAGALAGGFLLAAFETAWTAAFSAEWRDVASFAALTLVLILRPTGLSAQATRIDHAP